MTKDIKALIAIYTILILIGWNIGLKYEANKKLTKLNKELYEAKVIAVEMFNGKENAFYMLDSMNEYANELEDRIKVLENQSEIIKELSQLNDYKFTIALCFPENRFSKTRPHKDKKIIGKVCGVKDYWIKIIPELNHHNINTLKGGEIVFEYLLAKNDGDLLEALKDFKGSDKNIYPVLETLKLYKEIK